MNNESPKKITSEVINKNPRSSRSSQNSLCTEKKRIKRTSKF